MAHPPPPRPDAARPARPAMVDYAMSLEAERGDAARPPLARLLPAWLRRARTSARDFAEFDPQAYLRENPDVAAAGIDPLSHFVRLGWLEDRRLSHRLDTRGYLAANAHVRRLLLDIHAGRAAPPRRAPDSRPPPAPAKPGILIVGYVEAGLGLGESSRGLVRALDRSDLPFGVYPYNVAVENRHVGPFMPEHYDRSGRYEVTLFEANGDQMAGFLDQFGSDLRGGHTIFRTYWELARAPRAWERRLARFDEIWAPTTFVADAFRPVFDGPITIVPPCVSVEARETFPRSRFGLPSGRFLFLFTFDYSSVVERKNPLGLVEAFRSAFPAGDETVGLVLKSTGAPEASPETREALALAARSDPRIVVIDETISRDALLSLIRVCDCYVSLHRSEGFGFGMAEAMALGRPVIGTDYSGSTDFLSSETGYPVPFGLRPVLDGDYPHADGQSWAEPDIDAAAEILREVREDAPGRERRAATGKRLIEDRFGAEGVGRVATDRLRQILSAGPSGG